MFIKNQNYLQKVVSEILLWIFPYGTKIHRNVFSIFFDTNIYVFET